MKKHTIAKLFAIACVAALCAFGALALSGCTSDSEEEVDELTSDTGLTGGVAATVNGVEIEEDKVTRSINNMRLSYNYAEDDEWKEYLKNRKYTVESMRYEVLGQMIDQELVKQCAEQLDVTTDDEEIESYVTKMSDQYSSEEAWLKAVDDAGWEDGVEGYKKALNFSILEKKLKDQFNDNAEADLEDEENLLTELQNSAPTYDNAKRTSHILFSEDDEDLAYEVREKILNGELDFADAVAEYSTDDTTKENGGDVGWDKTNQFVPEYTDAFANLENIGDISEVTKSKYGYHIIEITDIWKAPEEITSSDDVPEEFVTEIKTNAVETNGGKAYDEWLEGIHPENDIQVNPMPEDVPYWVDMSDEYTEEEADEITQKALNKLIQGTEEVADDTTEAEAADGEGDTAAAAEAEDAAEAATAEDVSAAGEAAVPEEVDGESTEGESSE